MKTYTVYLNGEEIDRVFYSDDSDELAASVYRSLVNHDGYDPNIIVAREVSPNATYQRNEDGTIKIDILECGECFEQWNDAVITGITPAPSGRCPFEYEHEYDDDHE